MACSREVFKKRHINYFRYHLNTKQIYSPYNSINLTWLMERNCNEFYLECKFQLHFLLFVFEIQSFI